MPQLEHFVCLCLHLSSHFLFPTSSVYLVLPQTLASIQPPSRFKIKYWIHLNHKRNDTNSIWDRISASNRTIPFLQKDAKGRYQGAGMCWYLVVVPATFVKQQMSPSSLVHLHNLELCSLEHVADRCSDWKHLRHNLSLNLCFWFLWVGLLWLSLILVNSALQHAQSAAQNQLQQWVTNVQQFLQMPSCWCDAPGQVSAQGQPHWEQHAHSSARAQGSATNQPIEKDPRTLGQ